MRYIYLFMVFTTAASAAFAPIGVLQTIRQSTLDLNSSMSNWDGTYLAGMAIAKQMYNIGSALTTGLPLAMQSDYTTAEFQEALALGNRLVDEIGDTLDTGLKKKAKVEAVPLLGTRVFSVPLTGILLATRTFGEALVKFCQTPEDAEATREIIRKIEKRIQQDLDAV